MTARTCGLTPRRGAIAVTFAALAIALTACGSSGSSSSSSTTASSSTALVNTASNPTLGTILVDNRGFTLYTLINGGKPVGCFSPCTTVWPPLLVQAGTTPTAGPGVSNLGTTGGHEVTYKGFPLFRFSGDKAAGQTNGNNINSFGGTWTVIKAGSKPGT